ncbi:MAG: cytochrome d ubiquinol oxidase subunit II [Humibacter sp.]
MVLPTLWFVIVAFFWTGFFILEGFDFGVGALHKIIGRDDIERRVVINTIGPVWDGNEVWLIVAAASMFAAFPGWYATWLSALYLVVFLLLAALILRGVSFEFRNKFQGSGWRATWSWTLTIGSVFAPLLIGLGLGDLLAGLPVNVNGDFTGSFADLLTPFGIVLGITLVVLCLLHGATFLTLRTTDAVLSRARGAMRVLVIPGAVLAVVVAVWTVVLAPNGFWGILAAALPILGAIVACFTGLTGRASRLAFIATTVMIGGTMVTLFAHLYPNLLVSTTDSAATLTVTNSSSSHYSLQVMSIAALVMVPIVIAYQVWSYIVFRRRVTAPAVTVPSESTTPAVTLPSESSSA